MLNHRVHIWIIRNELRLAGDDTIFYLHHCRKNLVETNLWHERYVNVRTFRTSKRNVDHVHHYAGIVETLADGSAKNKNLIVRLSNAFILVGSTASPVGVVVFKGLSTKSPDRNKHLKTGPTNWSGKVRHGCKCTPNLRGDPNTVSIDIVNGNYDKTLSLGRKHPCWWRRHKWVLKALEHQEITPHKEQNIKTCARWQRAEKKKGN